MIDDLADIIMGAADLANVDLWELLKYAGVFVLLFCLIFKGWLFAILGTGLDALGLGSNQVLDALGIHIKWSSKATPTPTATIQATIPAGGIITPTPTPRPSYTPTPRPYLNNTTSDIKDLVVNGSKNIIPDNTQGPSVPNDQPFSEDITPIQDEDLARLHYLDICSTIKTDNSSLVVDLGNSYLGPAYVYPGDTLGARVRIYNTGQDLDEQATIRAGISKLIETPAGSFWSPELASRELTRQITLKGYAARYMNFSYTVPNFDGVEGVYRLDVIVYVDGESMAGFRKELEIL